MSAQRTRARGKALDDHADGIKQRIKDGAKELLADGEEAMENLGSTVRDQVCNRPLTSIVVASGIGLLLGVLVSRRRASDCER